MQENLDASKNLERYGRNIKIRDLYFRHAEKASGSVGSAGEISASLISPRGAEQSKSLGEDLAGAQKPAKDGLKIRSSVQPRTFETARETAVGYRGSETEDVFQPRIKMELSSTDQTQPKAWLDLYIKKWDARKVQLMKSRGIDPATFGTLSTKEQADIAETAEEPVMEEWIDQPDSEIAKIYPIERQAAQVAVLVRRDMQSALRLRSGSEIDRMAAAHKTIFEPLLMHMLKRPDGSRPQKLADIGGAMGLNDGFEIRTETDAGGTPRYEFIMHRVKDRDSDTPEYHDTAYEIDMAELDRLADMGIERLREERKAAIEKDPEKWEVKPE
jgi:broad specificity phosphatase PhoE